MVSIREERIADAAAREALLDAAYGPSRFGKASERLRQGRLPADGLSLVAVEHGRLVGTVRLWHVSAGPGRPALLLGPLAVHPERRHRGIELGGEVLHPVEVVLVGVPPVELDLDAKTLNGFPFIERTTGAPVLAQSVAWLDCAVRHEVPLGTHTLFVGEVVDAGFAKDEATPVLRMEDTRMNYGG